MVGDNTNSAALILVRIANAAMLVIATPDTLGVRRMVDVTHTHGEDESTLLRAVFFGEEKLARGMAGHVMTRFAPAVEPAHA